MAKRFGIVVNGKRYKDFEPRWIERNFNRPFPRKSCRIFVNSMSDVADWKREWIARVMARICLHPEHLFLFLSKRPWECEWHPWPNAMLGYSATCQDDIQRLVNRVQNVSFLSLEPLHGPIHLWGKPPRWIIVGSETGNRRGRVVPDAEWLKEIYFFCTKNHVPLFFKEPLRSIWPWKLPQEYPPWPRR